MWKDYRNVSMDLCHLKHLSLRCLQNETNALDTDKSMAASHTKLHHNSFFLRIARVEENDRQDLREALSLPQAAPMRWVWLVTIVKRPGKEEFSHPSWRSKKNTCNIMEAGRIPDSPWAGHAGTFNGKRGKRQLSKRSRCYTSKAVRRWWGHPLFLYFREKL